MRITPTIWSIFLHVEGAQPSWFLPGQSVWPRFEREGKTFTKIYSIASSPTLAPEIELCISNVGWASACMCALKPGDSIDMRGPYGLMTLGAVPETDLIYVAEGSGIAPIKSHIEWLFEQENPPNVWLFYGGTGPDEVPYHALWKDLSARELKFRYIPTVLGGAGEDLEAGPVERVIPAFIKDREQARVDICAVGDRVDQIKAALISQCFAAQNIRTERFCSY